ncbi:MAG: hypothetical protein PHP50_10810 [Lachnospiraceae bacterium]|nr:hypothetical protein [Lachnospiraceae bacterium]
MVGNDGTLIGADGKVISVATNHCYWHWLILLVVLVGSAAALVLGRKRKKQAWLVLGAAMILYVLFAILGTCYLDWIFAVVGIVVDAVIAAKYLNCRLATCK